MEMLAHEHPLTLIDINPEYPHEKDVYDDEDDLIAKQAFQHPCHRCDKKITYLHRYYYKCDQCDYSLHQLCGELPSTLQHASHSDYTLTLFLDESQKGCDMCKSIIEDTKLQYRCFKCMFSICLDCGMDRKQRHNIYHPFHKHPLVPICRQFSGECDACGRTHEGIFYQCITCFCIYIHKDCVFKPKRLLIEDVTDRIFSHTHPLTLTYSFPIKDQKAKFNPKCMVCDKSFSDKDNLWLYKFEKCRYYVHIECIIDRWKNYYGRKGVHRYKSGSIFCLLSDETYNIIKEFAFKEIDNNDTRLITDRNSHHQHPLVLADNTHTTTTVDQDLCNGCVRPIKDLPYYKCTSSASGCNYLLHAFCTRLPTKLKFGHPYYPRHTLILVPKLHHKYSLGFFLCNSCNKPCNGFAYSCVDCKNYNVDVRCAFMPSTIKHKSHPYHILETHPNSYADYNYCRICLSSFTYGDKAWYSCGFCGFRVHPECALLLPETITHKHDNHPMTLTYGPVQDHEGDYFCEVCEEELNPYISFYHCHKCVQSIHSACAPIIVPPAQGKPFFCALSEGIDDCFVNMKGGTINYKTQHHPHPLIILQGTYLDFDDCAKCLRTLFSSLVLFCRDCKLPLFHINCLNIKVVST